jgi:hypothetical protein
MDFFNNASRWRVRYLNNWKERVNYLVDVWLFLQAAIVAATIPFLLKKSSQLQFLSIVVVSLFRHIIAKPIVVPVCFNINSKKFATCAFLNPRWALAVLHLVTGTTTSLGRINLPSDACGIAADA